MSSLVSMNNGTQVTSLDRMNLHDYLPNYAIYYELRN